MRLKTNVSLCEVKAGDKPAGHVLTIVGDRELGSDLALALMRLEQTTLGIPESIRDLRLKLDFQLIGDPTSRSYMKGHSNA